MTPAMTLAQLLRWARLHLGGLPEAAREAELLLAHRLQLPRAFLLAHGERQLNDEDIAGFQALVERRRKGEPFAYIVGQREFWSLPLAVDGAVLVPRPETELVVERALALLGESYAEVADLGTGSGAIALAIASERPQWQVTATDASARALAVAARNAAALGLQSVRFLHGHWCEPLGAQRFALLLSNPPYVASGDAALRDPALQYEPSDALVSGPDGLAALREIIGDAPAHLLTGGWLVLEHGATQAEAVARLLVEAGFTHVRCHPDLAGLPRVTEAQRT